MAVVAAGAGTAWAMQGPDGPQYRLATVTRSSVRQTVDADGSLAAKQVVTPSFAVAGTVNDVDVAVGDTVTAGQVLATIDPSDLEAAVDSAKTTLAQAQQTLTDAENGVVDTTSTGRSGSAGTDSAGTDSTQTSYTTSSASTTRLTSVSATAVLTSALRSSGAPASGSRAPASGKSGSTTSITQLRARVKDDAAAVAAAAGAQVANKCTPALETTGTTVDDVIPDANSTISGTVGSHEAVVTLSTGGTVAAGGKRIQQKGTEAQPLATGSPYSFSSLTAGQAYTVQIQVVAIDDTACAAAIAKLGTTRTTTVADALDTFSQDLDKLQTAIAADTGSGSSGSSTPGSGSSKTASGTGKTGAGAGSGTANGRSSGSSSGGSTQMSGASSSVSTGTSTQTVTVTAEMIAADSAAVTKAKAELAVAKQQLQRATLTSPIAGTVAAVAVAKGAAVSAGSSTSTITIVGAGALSVDVDIPLAKIDLVKVGQSAKVTVDGQVTPLDAKVTYVGVLNSSGSTGSSASYPVTVQLDASSSTLYDGMGAQVAIAVGTAKNVLTVPLSALHTVGTRKLVEVDKAGKVALTPVTLGVVGADLVQVSKGVSVGQRVVIADVSAAVPSTTSTTTGRFARSGGGLAGLTGGGPTGSGGFGAAGGFAGGGELTGRRGGR